MRILRRAGYRRMPWKNGGGITEEIAREPEVGNAFRWRLSLARIDASGPFSDFSGYLRVMLLLTGNGLALRGAGEPERVLTRSGDCVRFDGSLALHCELREGPCEDLNLMVRQPERFEAGVEQVGAGTVISAAAGELLIAVALDGVRFTLRGGSHELPAADTLILAAGETAGIEPAPADGAARLFIARLAAA